MLDKSGLARCLFASGAPRNTRLMENFMTDLVNGRRINARKDLESDYVQFGEDVTE
jgi:hypothetical protein